jgi:hypothetical protein
MTWAGPKASANKGWDRAWAGRPGTSGEGPTPAYVQNSPGVILANPGASPITDTLPAPPTEGNTLLAIVGQLFNALYIDFQQPPDPGGQEWDVVGEWGSSGAADSSGISLYRRTVHAGDPQAYTFTCGTPSAVNYLAALVIYEFTPVGRILASIGYVCNVAPGSYNPYAAGSGVAPSYCNVSAISAAVNTPPRGSGIGAPSGGAPAVWPLAADVNLYDGAGADWGAMAAVAIKPPHSIGSSADFTLSWSLEAAALNDEQSVMPTWLLLPTGV